MSSINKKIKYIPAIEGERIRFKDIWSNVALAIGTLSNEARIKVEKMFSEMPDPDKEVLHAEEINKRWDAIFEVLNEDLK